MTTAKLTLRQQRFINAYLETGNATEACRRAGYKGDDQQLAHFGSENLRKPAVAAAIEQATAEEQDDAVMRRAELRQFWTRVVLGEVTEPRPVKDDEGRVTIEECAPSLKDRLKASELLGKSRGMFIERREHSGSIKLGAIPGSDDEAAARFRALVGEGG